MTTIGTFTRLQDNFDGSIATLTFRSKIAIRRVEKTSEQAPDYRVYASGIEVGAAWSMTSKANKPYLSVKFDDPSFSAPINCRLLFGDDEKKVLLVWNR